MISTGVQNCLGSPQLPKWRPFSFIFNQGNSRWQSCCFRSKIPWRKRKCETASSFVTKFWGEVFPNYHTVTAKRHSSMQNWLIGLPGWILCAQSPWCQKKWWACSWFCSSPVLPLLVFMSLAFPCKFHAVPLSDPSQNCIGLDTRLQIKGRKNCHIHLAAWNVVHWLPRYASTIVYHCIVLQPLYRWQHKPQTLWILLVSHANNWL
jgi:hypothetical protein